MKLSTSNTNANIAIYSSNGVLVNATSINSISIKIGTNNMMNSTSLSVGNSTINSTAIDTPSLIINGQVLFPGSGSGGIVNAQFFTASGTWTKPSGLTGNETVFMMLWGAGGGGAGAASGAGSGGACLIGSARVSDLTSTCAVTVGTSAALVAGGNSSIVINSSSTAIACGGGKYNDGGGGGVLGVANTTAGGRPLGGTSASTISTYGGGANGALQGVGGNTIFGGGGAGKGAAGRGGQSIFGGSGGCKDPALTISVMGGNGGNQGFAASAPGGGAPESGTAQPGARGEVRVWIIG
jgi:hypothetical protein